jgi:hypothetical protein
MPIERGRRAPGSAPIAQRIAGEGVPVVEGAIRVAEKSLEDALRGERGGHRQHAAREPLRGAEHVGCDARVLAGPHRAGATVSHRDLVADQEYVVPIAELARAAQERGVVDAHSGRTLNDRFEDRRCQCVRVRLERALERGACRIRVTRLARRRDVEGVEQDSGEGPAEHLDAAERGHAECLSVEAALQRQEAPPFGAPILRPVLERELHRHLDRRRPVVAVEDVFETRRCDRAERGGQLGGARVCNARQGDVAQALGLPAQRLHQARVTVAERARPPGGVAVQIAAPVDVVEPGAARLGHHERIHALSVALHGGIGAPHPLFVETNDPVALLGRHGGPPRSLAREGTRSRRVRSLGRECGRHQRQFDREGRAHAEL